jgi:Kdo2-lipid IVA lauroyltransferase/acyltransferase
LKNDLQVGSLSSEDAGPSGIVRFPKKWNGPAMSKKKKKEPGPASRFLVKAVTWSLGKFFCMFSWETADRLGTGLGRIILQLGIRKKVALENLAFVFDSETTPPDRRKTKDEIDRICKGAYETFGRQIVSYLRYELVSPEFFKEHCTYENVEILDQAMKKGRGVVVLGAHVGGWEMLMTCATAIGYPISLIAKNMPDPYIQKMVVKHRLRNGLKSIQPKNSREQVMETLSKNEIIALVFDQNMTKRLGIFVDMFGKPASTVKSTAGMVRESKAAVVGAVLRRVGVAQYHVKVYPEFLWIKHEDWETERFLNTQRWSRFIEEAILESPEQWFWLHRRWKRRPDEQELTTFDRLSKLEAVLP